MTLPTLPDLTQALSDAGAAHHEFEQVILNGVRDELWAGFYAAFALGRLGNFTTPSQLNNLLTDAPLENDWAAAAANYVLAALSN